MPYEGDITYNMQLMIMTMMSIMIIIIFVFVSQFTLLGAISAASSSINVLVLFTLSIVPAVGTFSCYYYYLIFYYAYCIHYVN